MPPKQRLRHLEVLQLKNGETAKPKADEEWRVICGTVTHITETITNLYLKGKTPDEYLSCFIYIAAAHASQGFTLNPILVDTNVEGDQTADSTKVWFNSQVKLVFSGDAAAIVRLIVEIVKTDPITGEHLA